MSLARKVLLWISENRSLRESLPQRKFIRQAVKKFMPGEEFEDAMSAAAGLGRDSIPTVFTRLGENIFSTTEAEQVKDHYLNVLSRIQEGKVEAEISIKLTQLGLDISQEFCRTQVKEIVQAAQHRKILVWIDMEQSCYVDDTLALYREIRRDMSCVGICLQAYLHRTDRDLTDLLPLSPSVRLVKGAYLEPAQVAMSRKEDVDANYSRLAEKMLVKMRAPESRIGLATHDSCLIDRITAFAEKSGISRRSFEIQQLFGIGPREQLRLSERGLRVRVLISYGPFWFPWYVRRLAERPANIWFVLKHAFKA